MKTKFTLVPAILLAILLMSFNGGGDKCKFDFEKADKFSGKMIRYDNYTLGGGTVKVQIGDNAGQFYFSLGVMVQGANLNSLMTTDTIFLKLENKSVEIAIPNDVVRPTAMGYMTTYSPICNLSKEEMGRLSKSKIIAMKYSISGKPFMLDMPDGKADKMMHTCSCLIQ